MSAIGWAVLIAAMAAGPAAPSRPTVIARDVLITSVSPRPPVSGVLRTFVILNVRMNGRADRMYQPYMRQDQFVPASGDRCTVNFHQERFARQPANPSVRDATVKIIDEMTCGTRRFSMRTPDRR